MVDVPNFRNGMAMLTGAVNVVTTDGPGGLAGFTATAVCSVTDQPPTLLVCLNQSSRVHDAFAANRVLCVNPLSAAQRSLSEVFSDRNLTAQERFARAGWSPLSTGSPAFSDSLVNFDCRITDIHSVGTHSVLYCEVVDLRINGTADGAAVGLVYFNRTYHQLSEHSRNLR